ncbi:MAG: AraC family transcriptional regulator [Bacteroidales bacterium]|nr:AraC family transcriptional regulator [Bacteroidales bacterium]
MTEKNRLSLILLNIGYAIHEADWNWKNICSPFFRIYLVVKGSACVTINGKDHILTPGRLYFIPPFTLHSDSCDSHFSLFYLHVYENHVQDISIFEQMSFPFEVNASAFEHQLFQRLLDINPDKGLAFYDPKSYESSDNLYHCIAETSKKDFPTLIETKGIILQIFSRFLSQSQKIAVTQDSRILKAIGYIHKNMEKNITIHELASLCRLSEDHFIRLFKQEIKITPINYINHKKIETAQLMMVIQKQPIKDIACSLSFENITYFNRLFKNMVGTTPTQYRDSLSTF